MREFDWEVAMAAVRYEKQERVGHIILDRPPANSYDKAFLDDLSAAIDKARFAAPVKAIVGSCRTAATMPGDGVSAIDAA